MYDLLNLKREHAVYLSEAGVAASPSRLDHANVRDLFRKAERLFRSTRTEVGVALSAEALFVLDRELQDSPERLMEAAAVYLKWGLDEEAAKSRAAPDRVSGHYGICCAAPRTAVAATAAYHHIHLTVPNGNEGARWYIRNMGCQAAPNRPKEAPGAQCGTTLFLFFSRQPTGPSEGSGANHIGFSFANLEAKVKALEGAGVKSRRRYVRLPAGRRPGKP